MLSLPETWSPTPLAASHDTARHLLVCDAPGGGLAAAAIVTFAAHRTWLEVLRFAPGYESPALEARLLGVAEALAEAFGCRALGVGAARAA